MQSVTVRPHRVKRARTGHVGPVGRYVAHAERRGVEAVFETAFDDRDFASTPVERVERLATLARRLSDLDPSWRSPVLKTLAPYLVNIEGHDANTVAALCGVSRRTILREIAEQERCATLDRRSARSRSGPQKANNHGGLDVTNPGGKGDWLRGPILSREAPVIANQLRLFGEASRA